MRIRLPRAGRPKSDHLTAQSGPAPNEQSLADRLAREQQLPPDEAAAIVGEVAHLLAAGHAVGNVHGDIRPATIGFMEEGRVGLIGAPPPRPGENLAYLAPEQIERRRSGAAADVYSLGAVFFELLVGRPPNVRGEPERVGSLVTVPGQIDGIVTAMLAENPSHRPRAEDVVCVLESGLNAPPKKIVRASRKGRKLWHSPSVLGTLMVLLLPGFVLAGSGLRRAGETRSYLASAERLADILPTSFALAFDLSIERDALRSGGRVTEEFIRVTDQSIEDWKTEVEGIDAGGDPGLRRRTERTAAALEHLSDIRPALRSGDRASTPADAATYTNAVNGLFDLAAELPTFDDEDLARQAKNLEAIGPVSEVLGLERQIMADALRKRRISDRSLADLNAAQSSWVTHSESIYQDAEPATQQALDSISGNSFALGSYGVSSQRAVIRVVNARDVADVVRQLKDGAKGQPVDQVWLADAAIFVQGLKKVVVAAADEFADDIDRERMSAQNQRIGWVVFAGITLALLATLGVVLLRSRGRSSGTTPLPYASS